MKSLRRWRALFQSRKLDAEMAEEMRLHLELQEERNRAAGMGAEEAHYAARRMFGGVEQIKEQARDQRGWVWFEQIHRDVQYALRMLRKAPGFTAAAVVVLALGIGANATIFNLVQTLLFSPPAYAHPAEVLRVVAQEVKNPNAFRDFSYPAYHDIREHNDVFAATLAYRLVPVGVGRSGEGRRAMAALVSSNYFSVLGVSPIEGRGFLPDEETPGRDVAVAVVSHRFWKKRRFDPALVGSQVLIDGRVFKIVGIMPEGFTGAPHLFSTEIWLPLGVQVGVTGGLETNQPVLNDRGNHSLIVLGRLRPGITPSMAAAAMPGFATSLKKDFPEEQRDWTLRLESPSRFASAGNDRKVASVGAILLGMASVVLVVACLNLAALLLARGTARRKEIAIRLALGGGRARIVRQLVTEGLVLAVFGGLAGLVVALWSADLIVGSLGALAPVELAWSTGLNGSLIAAIFGLCVLATLCFAVGPAFRLSRADVTAQLKEHASDDPVRRRRKFVPRNPLVSVQLALSLGLLTGAALFIRSASHARGVLGALDLDGVYLVEVDSSLAGLGQREAQELYRRLGDRFAALPGVEQATVSDDVPLGGQDLETRIRRIGDSGAGRPEITVKWNGVGADYFGTVGLPLLRGRPFTAAEATQSKSPPVVIVNEVVAKQLWPGGNALGQRIRFSDGMGSGEAPRTQVEPAGAGGSPRPGDETFEVVGVVPAVRHNLFEAAPDAGIYLPFARGFQSHVFFHLKFTGLLPAQEEAVAGMLRGVVREIAPALPVLSLTTYREHLDNNLQIWIVRAGTALFCTFGGLALGLATVGLYGVVAYSVARRTREIGIRIALGAGAAVVQRMILREWTVTLAGGLAMGLLFSFGIGKLMSSLLYQVGALDPVAFAVGPGVLLLVALLGCWLPARRATKVDPMVALRCE